MNDKNLLTWSLRILNDDYRHDFEQYGNKIYSIGFHEWEVDKYGKIAVMRAVPEANAKQGDAEPDPGAYKNFNSNPSTGWDATTYDRYAGNRDLFPQYIEKDMARWEHIDYYMQFVIFGPNTVANLLDSATAQSNFIQNLRLTIQNFETNGIKYDGIELDVEGSFSASKWDARVGDDVKLINLFKKVKNEVIIDNFPDKKFRINAHAMWGAGVPDYYRFHNYALFAQASDKLNRPLFDEIQIMTYDFAWVGSAPGPSTPLFWLRDVAEWVKKCFESPLSRMSMDQVYFGSAGYGTRYPVHRGRDVNDPYRNYNSGARMTYRNLVDWQNGYYKHYDYNDPGNVTVNQDFIPMNAYDDPVSKNQIMYNHQYDYFAPSFMERENSFNDETVAVNVYNEVEYATGYSKRQYGQFNGVKAIVGVLGESEPTPNTGPTTVQPDLKMKRSETATLTVAGASKTFQAYNTVRRNIVPVTGQSGYVCGYDPQQPTISKLTYTFNLPSSGSYKVVGLISFPFYGSTKLGGTINGTSFTMGGATLPDYYPLMFKAVHGWDLGTFSLNAGTNTIEITGDKSDTATPIFGFVICEEFNNELIGGYMSADVNIQGFKKRDKTNAKLPDALAFTSEVLQQSPRPAIMWEDIFAQFLEDPVVQGENASKPDYTNSGLTGSTYYRWYGFDKRDYGGGTLEERDAQGVLKRCYATVESGYSQGYWDVKTDTPGDRTTAHAKFTSGDSRGGGVTTGQLMLNYEYEMDVAVSSDFRLDSGTKAGIRFGSKKPGNGFIFRIDIPGKRVELIYENAGSAVQTWTASLGDRVIALGDFTSLQVLVNAGKVRCKVGRLNFFTDLDISAYLPSRGACGIWTNGSIRVYKLNISSTKKWETLERMSIIVDGQTYSFGELYRPGITRDKYGYLNYSGMNELNIRGEVKQDSQGNPIYPEISLDYVFFTKVLPTFTGKKNVTIRLDDAGIWFKRLYVGDSKGMSITYCGDDQTFEKAINLAVYDYGAKGIGLWTLGQADPRVLERLPDVVPWHP